jgi:CRISPR-associated endonuclease/helicase Cas3
MAEMLEKHCLDERQADGSARFLESGYFATRGVFRDTNEYTLACVLTSDLEAVKACLDARKPYDGFIVGVPKNHVLSSEARPNWLPKYLNMANADRYNPRRGFQAE